MMGEQAVLLSKGSGIATITLNRPAAMNSMNKALVDELIATLCRHDRAFLAWSDRTG